MVQLNTSNVFLATPGPLLPVYKDIVRVDDVLRSKTTLEPKKTYSELPYDFPNGHVTFNNSIPSPIPMSTRADTRNFNIMNK